MQNMENLNSETPIEKIEFLVNSLIDFSNNNEFDFTIYNEFAKASSKTFNRYFTQIHNQLDKEKIISDLKTDFYFSVSDIVTNMMATRDSPFKNLEPGVTYYIGEPIPDKRIRGYESNYKKLIEYFLNSVEFELCDNLNTDQSNKLTINQIALKCYYEGVFINRENANKYLKGTKHTSGDKLYNEYIKWTDRQNRKADPEGRVKLINKIKLFEKVIVLLPEDKKTKAIDELNILNSFKSNYQ